MKAYLMYRDRDVDLEADLPAHHEDLIADLGLDPLLSAMAAGDKFLYEVAQHALLDGLDDPAAIVYRQDILRDCLAQPDVIRDLYTLAVSAMDAERKVFHGFFTRSPDIILHRALEVMEMFLASLRALRHVTDEHADAFGSDGFRRFFDMLATELDDTYLDTVASHLKTLKFGGGVLISARLGAGNTSTGYVVRRPNPDQRGWARRLTGTGLPQSYTYRIPDRDEAGARALTDLRGRGTNEVANALSQSVDHILDFFRMLRRELGFYVGCLNLADRLAALRAPTCFPTPHPPGPPRLTCAGLYDVSLALTLDRPVVGNDITADGRTLIAITGANQGGKSTFLRSIGLAQLMMQAGMAVPAAGLAANTVDQVFTHFKREEDTTMESGKLDEELRRMSTIADTVTGRSMVLFNESFASTNEREGSEIARQVVRALTGAGTKVCFVTHLYDLAHGWHQQHADGMLFLRAERRDDGHRTFKLIEGEPLPTSYGEDLYRNIFAAAESS